MRQALAAFGIALSLAQSPAVAKADTGAPLPFELTWEAPASCPDAGFVRHRIEQIVHGAPIERVVAKALIEATADEHFRLELSLRTGDVEESKTLTAPSCVSLAQATATIVALALDPSTAPADAEPTSPPPAENLPAASASPARLEPGVRGRERVAERPARSWYFAGGAFVSLASGTLPAASASFGASAALRLQRFRVGLLGAASVRQSSMFTNTAGLSFDLLEGGAWGAYVVPLGSAIGIGPSANLEGTCVTVRSFGIRTPHTQSILWPTVAVGGRLEATVARWLALVGRVDLLFPLDAQQFSLLTVDAPVNLHEPDLPSVRLSVGAEIVIP